jgi:superfamily II DNA or RNA helicase
LEHGTFLTNLITELCPTSLTAYDPKHPLPVYYVSGEVDGEDREEIRKIVNTHKKSITVASVGTFSKGVNIPNLHNIIVASPSKSQIRVLQSIGRGLRKTNSKLACEVYDLADDLSTSKKPNYTYKHFAERLQMYMAEDFPYKVYKIDLKASLQDSIDTEL